MNLVSAFVVFSVTWFLALYCLLPIGVRSQEEAGDNIPTGAMAGAPSKPNLRLKAIGATIISDGCAGPSVWSGRLSAISSDRLSSCVG